MKILFSPEYSGHVYARSITDSVMMDTTVANTLRLVEIMELRLGMHYETTSQQQNLAKYYEAMNRYMMANPGNCLEASFKVSGLKTAKAVMAWRDGLRAAQWDCQGEDISDRLKALVEIEKLYRPVADKDLTERVHQVIDEIQRQQLDCNDIELALNCNLEWIRPLEKSLVDALTERGAKVSLLPMVKGEGSNLDIVRKMMTGENPNSKELNANDESLLIYRFADLHQANEYLASENLCGADVCIDTDNKALDHQLHLMGLPQSGSIARDSAPQLTQLLVVGIGLFYPTLNVNTLLQWLAMPLHPLDSSLRYRLAGTIARKGGYRNDACREIIEKYINGDYLHLSEEQQSLSEEEQQSLRRKKMNDRKQKVNTFLPSMTPVSDICRDSLQEFTNALASWCRQKIMLSVKDEEGNLWQEQLSKVIDMTETFNLLLNTVYTPTLETKTVESWISALDKTEDFTASQDEQGCTIVVSTPANIISMVDKTLWAGFNGAETQSAELSFLSPSEKEALASQWHIVLWGDNEGRYHDFQELIPLLHTSKQIILVVCERNEGKPIPKHPLLIRLEQQFGKEASNTLKNITRNPSIDESQLTTVVKVRNERASGTLEFGHADKLQWPGHLSPTSIRSLVEDPFSYLMENLLKIQPDAKTSMQDKHITAGNVAHKVIEILFSPAEGNRTKSAEAIEVDIEQRYDTVFDETIDACGAIFLIPENLLEMGSLRIRLRQNLKTLCNIIKNNRLRVLGCEIPVKGNVGFGLPEEQDEVSGKVFDTKGFIDMVLEDAEGHPVVFDLKWSFRSNYYKELLKNNDSIQLEFYRRMLHDERRNEVRKVAYFIMPVGNGRLYSLNSFEGDNCVLVTTENDINVVDVIVEEVRTIKSLIDQGKVDVSTLGDYSNYKLFATPIENDNQ